MSEHKKTDLLSAQLLGVGTVLSSDAEARVAFLYQPGCSHTATLQRDFYSSEHIIIEQSV